MYNFFANENSRHNNCYQITDSDCNHIVNVLRMKIDDELLISCNGKSDLCKIKEIYDGTVIAEIINENCNNTELPVKLYLFQGLPKSDKMELIIQKAVELGAHCIVPVEMNRCVVKLDEKKKKSKVSRWQSIAESAAKQSKRNSIPEIHNVLSFAQAVDFAKSLDLILVPYENESGMKGTKDALKLIKNGMSVGIFIGPEGGFEENEVEKTVSIGAKIISLGQRILRTETAAITSVAMCMLHIEMNTGGDEK